MCDPGGCMRFLRLHILQNLQLKEMIKYLNFKSKKIPQAHAFLYYNPSSCKSNLFSLCSFHCLSHLCKGFYMLGVNLNKQTDTKQKLHNLVGVEVAVW